MTELSKLFEGLRWAATQNQINSCKRYTSQSTLVSLFIEALKNNAKLPLNDKPFGGRNFQPLSPTTVVNGPDNYNCWLLRGQVITGNRRVDCFAKTDTRPVLQEDKSSTDETPFYAFIQLLAALSEIATHNQLQRANRHNLFNLKLEHPQRFDLHIILNASHKAFTESSQKHELLWLTSDLANEFKKQLSERGQAEFDVIGTVLCLREDPTLVALDDSPLLECIWHT